MDNQRKNRKIEHLKYALETESGPLSPGWEDLHLIHQALLKNDLEEIDTSLNLFKKRLNIPLIINAMTGGAEESERYNRDFAEIASEFGLGIAVGSQTVAINNKKNLSSFKIVRKVNPSGLVIANISAGAKPESAVSAVEMIEADALQLHLNGVQELVMYEGDRQFKDWAKNIERICKLVSVPVIAKEVGNGISRETARQLSQLGISAIDIGGSGGTNFTTIELARHQRKNLDFLRTWGIPTAISLLEVCSLNLNLLVFASGGITNSVQIMKALVAGADAVGIAGYFLRKLEKEGIEALRKVISDLRDELKILMLLTGAKNIAELKQLPLVITGFTREWCEQRGLLANNDKYLKHSH